MPAASSQVHMSGRSDGSNAFGAVSSFTLLFIALVCETLPDATRLWRTTIILMQVNRRHSASLSV